MYKKSKQIKLVDFEKLKIGVIGLGYVGLPLAVEFGKRFHTYGYDLSKERVIELNSSFDSTQELTSTDIERANKLTITSTLGDLISCNVYIVTVPTPILPTKIPDMSFLRNACQSVGTLLSENDIIVFESTVYPGATEEFCVPILEKVSGKIFNRDFYVGYSPERINPGDKNHTVRDIVKITSGSIPDVAEFIDNLYTKIILAGTHKASSIKIAEAAKVIENTQRDLNIGLINELSRIFEKMNLDTNEVLEAASTKWNFLDFRPGLVGGHCIGVDPYYLTYKAREVGIEPSVILAGRASNEMMVDFVCDLIVSELNNHRINLKKAKVLQLGITFKENCPDTRNSKSIAVLEQLSKVVSVDLYDPWATNYQAPSNIRFLKSLDEIGPYYDAVIITVGHDYFKNNKAIKRLEEVSNIRIDIKNIMPKSWSTKKI